MRLTALATRAASMALLAIAGLHVIWASGSSWPLPDGAALGDEVAGRPDADPPSATACLVVAGLLAAACRFRRRPPPSSAGLQPARCRRGGGDARDPRRSRACRDVPICSRRAPSRSDSGRAIAASARRSAWSSPRCRCRRQWVRREGHSPLPPGPPLRRHHHPAKSVPALQVRMGRGRFGEREGAVDLDVQLAAGHPLDQVGDQRVHPGVLGDAAPRLGRPPRRVLFFAHSALRLDRPSRPGRRLRR